MTSSQKRFRMARKLIGHRNADSADLLFELNLSNPSNEDIWTAEGVAPHIWSHFIGDRGTNEAAGIARLPGVESRGRFSSPCMIDLTAANAAIALSNHDASAKFENEIRFAQSSHVLTTEHRVLRRSDAQVGPPKTQAASVHRPWSRILIPSF